MAASVTLLKHGDNTVNNHIIILHRDEKRKIETDAADVIRTTGITTSENVTASALNIGTCCELIPRNLL